MVMNLDCTLTITNDGEIQNMNGTIINTPELSEYFLNKCSVKCVTVKYNSKATKITLDIVQKFFVKTLTEE